MALLIVFAVAIANAYLLMELKIRVDAITKTVNRLEFQIKIK